MRAPAHWQAVDFISDLHLQAAEPATVEAFGACLQRFLQGPADALFILGDLFEVWVGDDVLTAPPESPDHRCWRHCAALLHAAAQVKPVYFMHGNRDFLLGDAALIASGMAPLSDPTVLIFHDQRWLLSHGDALCLDDTDYMHFRAQVRSVEWQTQFLARPLSEREALARQLRAQSEARKQANPFTDTNNSLWADVDGPAAQAWLRHAQAFALIHGHTHRPGQHDLGDGLQRVVLSDWDAAASPPRGEVLRLDAEGLRRLQLVPTS